MNYEIVAQVVYKKCKEDVQVGILEKKDLFKEISSDIQNLEKVINAFVETAPKADPPPQTDSGITLNCPACGKSEWFEDNRAKRKSDIKFSKIPVFACSVYKDSKGCGFSTWDEEITGEMTTEHYAKANIKDENVPPF